MNNRWRGIVAATLLCGTLAGCAAQQTQPPSVPPAMGKASAPSEAEASPKKESESKASPKKGDESAVAPEQMEDIEHALQAVVIAKIRDGKDYPEQSVGNDYAMEYLLNMAANFYADQAQVYAEIQDTGYERYVALDENFVDALLRRAFGDRFTTEHLITDNDAIIYNGHAYYIGIREGLDCQIQGTDAPSPSQEDAQYRFTYVCNREKGDLLVRLKANAAGTVAIQSVAYA